MNILVFSSLYPNNMWPSHGVFVKERMTQFAKITKSDVTVVAPVPYFPPVKGSARWRFSQVSAQETIEGLEVFHPRYFMTPKVGMSLYGWLMFLSVLPKLRALHRQRAFDLIDAHFLYPDGFAATLLGRMLKIPVVVSARGNDVLLYSRWALIRPLLCATLQRSSQVIAISHELKAGMVRLGAAARKITVIPNGVDSEKFHPISQTDARQTLKIEHKKTLLSVGHLIHRKGFDRLLAALRTFCVEQQEQDVQLFIVGEGELRKELEGMRTALGLEERVHLVGSVSHRDLALWYSAADLFCLLTRQEGCPNVVLESLACGTPVVATAVGESPYLLPHEELGLLTGPDEQEIARQLTRALRKSWSRNAVREHAMQYTWERVAHAVAGVFDAAVGIETRMTTHESASSRQTFPSLEPEE